MSFEVIIDQVRSFASRIQIPIRPLTLLVGENSSGKSTFLACIAAAHGLRAGFSLPEFNTPPYNLGTFETIATNRTGHKGKAKEFTVGCIVNSMSAGIDQTKKRRGFSDVEMVATFENLKGTPSLRTLRIETSKLAVSLEYHEHEVQVRFNAKEASGFKAQIASAHSRKRLDPVLHPRLLIHELLVLAEYDKRERSEPSVSKDQLGRLFREEFRAETELAFSSPRQICSSFAPIRSKPQRTYEPVGKDFDSEGDHIPTVLSQLNRFIDNGAFREFGEASGLFETLSIKRLGRGSSAPFQIQFTVGGRTANFADIGYGVSQVLPIVVHSSVRRTSTSTTLIQQPEVHLHPRAQAALGTFFSRVADLKHLFVVETHSDYLIDRVRQEVAKGTLKPDDVQILFFDKPALETTIHRLTLDENGNVENAPDEYRSFFMEESLNLLTRTEG